MEAAIKTTQEVIACANQEKLKWQDKINELNVHKQILQDKENLLVVRAKELENLTQVMFIIYTFVIVSQLLYYVFKVNSYIVF